MHKKKKDNKTRRRRATVLEPGTKGARPGERRSEVCRCGFSIGQGRRVLMEVIAATQLLGGGEGLGFVLQREIEGSQWFRSVQIEQKWGILAVHQRGSGGCSPEGFVA